MKQPIWPVLALALLLLCVAATTPWHAAFWGGDSARHAMNGALILDWLRSGQWRHPMAFATAYYLHYPAITITLYPPVVPLIEAAAYARFGVCQPAAQAIVTLSLAWAAWCTYRIARQAVTPWQAFAASALLLAMPMTEHLGRQVMLEIPALAAALAGAALVLRYLEAGRPAVLYAGVALGVLAAYIKQPAGFSLAVYPVLLVWDQGFAALRRRAHWVALAGAAAALLPLAAYTLMFGRFTMDQIVVASEGYATGPFFYLTHLPEIAGWAPLLLAGLGVASQTWPSARTERESRLIVWGVLWLAVNLLINSLIAHKEPRFGLFMVAPVPILGAVFLARAARTRPGWGVAVPPAAAAALCAITLARSHAPVIEGVAPLATYIASHTAPGEVVMVHSDLTHDLAFDLRAGRHGDALAGPVLLRPIKFLAVYSGPRETGVADRHVTPAQISGLIDAYGVRLIALQPGYWTDVPSIAAFQAYVTGGAFRRVASFALTGDTDPRYGNVIEIWENPHPAARTRQGIDFDMPMLGGRLQGK